MHELSFSIQEAIEHGFKTFRLHWKKVALSILVLGAIGFIVAMVVASSVVFDAVRSGGHFPSLGIVLLLVLLFILFIIVFAYFLFGYTRLLFNLANGTEAKVGDIFKSPRAQFWQYLGGKILSGLIIAVGFIFLIVPGIIFAICLSLFAYVFLDKKLSAMDSLRESWKLTKGHRLNIFFFGVVVFVASLIVSLIPIIGGLLNLFVISPITFFSMFYIYRKITKLPIPIPGLPSEKENKAPQPLEPVGEI